MKHFAALLVIGCSLLFLAACSSSQPTPTVPPPAPTAVAVPTKPAAPTPTAAPTPAPENVYVVKAGDALWNIAQLYGTTVDAIAKANNLSDPGQLSVGQRLTIPAEK